MEPGIATGAGGLGLFLLGTLIMTDGLRELAGRTLEKTLARFTKTAFSGALTGAFVTVLVQSSSATTVAAVGFVDAGLMRFSQALGVIFGANVGTTLRGWLVVLLGFKLEIGALAMPVVLVGALLRLFGRRRARPLGLAIAGFALIFVGLDIMRIGMSALAGRLTPQDFPGGGVTGQLLLVLLGMAITVITQSSGAGVAAALTALEIGAIEFGQAAALVIGMDVGTTSTALLASMGGSLQTRRTGFSHVLFNLFTAVLAFLLLSPYERGVAALAPGLLEREPELGLVGFHTTFNLLGTAIAVPLAGRFARFIERLITERGNPFTRRLSHAALQSSELALRTAQVTLFELSATLLAVIPRVLGRDVRADERAPPATLAPALHETAVFLDEITTTPGQPAHARHLALWHATEHLQRAVERLAQQEQADRVRSDDTLCEQVAALVEASRALVALLPTAATEASGSPEAATVVKRLNDIIATAEPLRGAVLAAVAAGQIGHDDGLDRLAGVRWLSRLAHHLARIAHHLFDLGQPSATRVAAAAEVPPD